MLKYFLSINLIIICSLSCFAQTHIDALRYSQWTSGATARSLGVGGAYGALGGDLSSANINPGGLGVFRTREISLTPAYNLANISSDFSGNTVDTDKNKFRFAGAGAAFVSLNDDYDSNWKATTFAVTYNQIANLDKQFSYQNTTQGSIAESFIEQADGFGVDDLLDPEWLAYQVYMIDDSLFGPGNYTSPLDENSVVLKSEDFESKGSIYDLSFSFGTNYRDKLYLGATLGLPILNYEQVATYREEDINNTYVDFDEMRYTTGFTTTGIGANLKIGAIYKINRKYRVGLAVHTPTNFGLTDTEYYIEMAKFPSMNPEQTLSYDEPLEYNLRTSWRFTASGAAVFRNFGFVSADVEWVDYGANSFSFPYSSDECPTCESDARFTNNIIQANYTSAINARLGAEYRYKIFRARAGYAYYGNPFNTDPNLNTENGAWQNISFGIGIRPESVYLDLALVRNVSNELYVPYRTFSSPNVQEVNSNIGNTRIVVTGGFQF